MTGFGRRVSTDRLTSTTPVSSWSPPVMDTLSPEAEAFRRELAQSRRSGHSDFSEWNRSQRGKRLVAWVLSALLMVPGAICFMLQTSMTVSSGVEIGGIVLGWWLRRARKRHIQTIVRWKDPLDSQP